MKTKIWTFLIVLTILTVFSETSTAQTWKDLKEKAKKEALKKKTNNSKVDNQTNSSNNTQTNTTKTQTQTQTQTNTTETNVTQTNNLPELVIDPNNPIKVIYKDFWKAMKLNASTGELNLEQISIKNLPEGNYGVGADEHKIVGVLKFNDKVVQSFNFNSVNKNYSIKGRHFLRNDNKKYTVKEAGDYLMEFQIDGKKYDEINFNIVLTVDAEKTSRFFIYEPLNYLASLGAQNSKGDKPNMLSYFIFRFYTGVLTPEAKQADPVKMNIILMKGDPDGENTYIGGYDNELNIYWKEQLYETDNYTFKKPTSPSVTYEDIANNDGKYYIDLFVNNKHLRYKFEIKDKEIISDLSIRGNSGFVCIEPENIEIPKYDGFQQTLSTSGISDNVRMSISKADGGSIGMAANKPLIFTDGKLISKSISMNDKIRTKYEYRFSGFTTTLIKGNEIIAQHINSSIYTGNSSGNFVTIMNSTDEKQPIYAVDYFTGNFMEALAKLPAGTHKLKFVWEISSDNDKDIVGVRTVTFKSDGKNLKYIKWGKETNELILLSLSEISNLAFSTSSSNDFAYYVNTCGRLIWIRQNGTTEYYMYPGDKIKFDRSSGYIEQWNFGTKKWKNTNDFIAYKTVYKLNNISLANVQMKQPEWGSKLTPLLDKEFKSDITYLAEVEKLIGKEIVVEYRNMILMAAKLDWVKVCQ